MDVLSPIASITDPAARLRIIQYKPYFSRQGINLTIKQYTPPKESDPPKVFNLVSKNWNDALWRTLKVQRRRELAFAHNNYSLIWQNRLLVNDSVVIEKKYRGPWVFDVDDAIWLSEGTKQVEEALRLATMVFAGNEYLAEFSSRNSNNVKLVPTTVDCKKYFGLQKTPELFTLGWIGTKSNFDYLYQVRDEIMTFLSDEKNSRLMIVSDQAPEKFPFDNKRIVFRKWQADTENEMINEFSVGLMPMPENPWTLGKCSAKMLQYMACSIPTIASPVGNNQKLFQQADIGFAAASSQDWLQFFHLLKNEPQVAATLGKNGRKLAEENYSTETWSSQISSHFKTLV